MALTFPNRSRSYDERAGRIRFIGHDGMFEVPFLVEVDALAKQKAQASDTEAGHLAAFDVARETVHDVARAAYAKGRKNMYVLTRADFR